MSYLETHAWLPMAIYWMFSAAVSSMPGPTTASGGGYSWLFGFLHTLAGDISGAFASKLPPKP